MQYHQFKTLARCKDCRYLLKEGACVAERRIGHLPALLFQLEQKYVEVILNHNSMEVMALREFTDLDELTPYLEEIVIPFI